MLAFHQIRIPRNSAYIDARFVLALLLEVESILLQLADYVLRCCTLTKVDCNTDMIFPLIPVVLPRNLVTILWGGELQRSPYFSWSIGRNWIEHSIFYNYLCLKWPVQAEETWWRHDSTVRDRQTKEEQSRLIACRQYPEILTYRHIVSAVALTSAINQQEQDWWSLSSSCNSLDWPPSCDCQQESNLWNRFSKHVKICCQFGFSQGKLVRRSITLSILQSALSPQ